MSRRLYVSDVHLELDDSLRLNTFAQLLRQHSDRVDEIILLGDICEMWIGDDDDADLVQQLARLFQQLSDQVRLAFLPGNRDFLLGEEFARRTGLERLPDPCQLADGTLLSHGDALCTDDAPYQQVRALFRSATWQSEILAKSLAERRQLGADLRAQSKAANANKASNIMDVNAAAVSALFEQHQAELLIHGHTHRPGIHTSSKSGSKSQRRVVLGSWERCAWWALQNGTDVTLHAGPLHPAN